MFSKSPRIEQLGLELSMIGLCLPNGNLIKISQTNLKHFTVGDAMIIPVVKMGNKTPKTFPSPCASTHHPKPQLGRFMYFQTGTPQSPHWLQRGAPKITPSHRPIPKHKYLSHPWTRSTYHPKPLPYPICHFPQCTGQTDTHGQTNRWLVGNYRPLSLYRERHGLENNFIIEQLSCKF